MEGQKTIDAATLCTGRIATPNPGPEAQEVELLLWEHLNAPGCICSSAFVQCCACWKKVPFVSVERGNDLPAETWAIFRGGGSGLMYQALSRDSRPHAEAIKVKLDMGHTSSTFDAGENVWYVKRMTINSLDIETVSDDQVSELGDDTLGTLTFTVSADGPLGKPRLGRMMELVAPPKPTQSEVQPESVLGKRVSPASVTPKLSELQRKHGVADFKTATNLPFDVTRAKQSKRRPPSPDYDEYDLNGCNEKTIVVSHELSVLRARCKCVQHLIRDRSLGGSQYTLMQLKAAGVELPDANALVRLNVTLRAIKNIGIKLSSAQEADLAAKSASVDLTADDDEARVKDESSSQQTSSSGASSQETAAFDDDVAGLDELMKGIAEEHRKAADAWFAEQGITSVVTLLEVPDAVDDFVKAIRVKALAERIIRGRLVKK